jgi:hypothetical protein
VTLLLSQFPDFGIEHRLAYARDTLMRLVGALDTIFAFAITGKLSRDFVNTARHVSIDRGFELDQFTNFEFVGRHIAPLSR